MAVLCVSSWLCVVDAMTKDTINKINDNIYIIKKSGSSPGLVHSPSGLGPTKSGPVQPLTGLDLGPQGPGPDSRQSSPVSYTVQDQGPIFSLI